MLRDLLVAFIAANCLVTPSAWAKDLSDTCSDAAARAVLFLTNAHTGKQMKAEDWMTDHARNAPMFAGFGGIDSLVNQSTKRAQEFGGLKSVDILKSRKLKSGCEVSAEVKFLKEHRDRSNPAVAASEEMIWTFHMTRHNGVWRIAG